MKGFTIAQGGHVVQALAPVSTSGGKTAQAFSMKKYQHASIILLRGVQAAQSTSIVVNACSDASGDNPVAIPFNVFKAETTNSDVLGPKVAVAAAGFQPTGTSGTFYVIELDASELPDGKPYVQVVETNGANADLAAVVAVLSGARFEEDQSPSETV